jgi:DNA-binding transcriptional LysR family regulator
VFPLVASRIPQRIAVHVSKSMPLAKVDRDTGDLSPNLMLDSFTVAKAAVMAGDAVGLAPLTAIEPELRSGKLALVPFEAPWLHLSYGLFYPRKKALSRAAQLFVTQLRQVETALQVREQRAVARLQPKRKTRKTTGTAGSRSKRSAKTRSRRAKAPTRRGQ